MVQRLGNMLGLSAPVAALSRQLWGFILAASFLLLLGMGLGIFLTKDLAYGLQKRLLETKNELQVSKKRVQELERSLIYQENGEVKATPIVHHLKIEDHERHMRKGAEYVISLRKTGAQAAANLMEWFLIRWDELLDQPQDNDRVTRRAALLSLLIGGMAQNLNPPDYVAWQAEFLSGNWLGGLHFDIDGQGLPGYRYFKSSYDGFADVSVCHIAMALNQAVKDARILVMPDMQCDKPETRMSIFLQAATFDEAISDFVRALKKAHYAVVEKQDQGIRLILLGSGQTALRRTRS